MKLFYNILNKMFYRGLDILIKFIIKICFLRDFVLRAIKFVRNYCWLKTKDPVIYKIMCPFCYEYIDVNVYKWKEKCPHCHNYVIKFNCFYEVPPFIIKDGKKMYVLGRCFFRQREYSTPAWILEGCMMMVVEGEDE